MALPLPPEVVSQKLATTLLAAAPVLLVQRDPSGCVAYVNPFFEQVTGFALEHLRGRDWFTAVVAECDRERLRALFQQTLQGEQTSGTVATLVTRAGVELKVEWQNTALYGDDHALVGVLSVGIDVTERLAAQQLASEHEQQLRRSQAQLFESEQRFAGLVAASPVALFELDAQGQCTFVSERWSELTGLPGQRALGMGWVGTLHEDDRAQAQAAWARGVATGGSGCDTLRLQRPDGSVIWVLSQVVARHARSGEVIGFTGTLTDITELRHAQELASSSLARMNAAQKLAKIGSWELDLVKNELSWSEEVFRIFELDPTRFGASYEAFLKAVHPGDRALVDATYRRSVESQKPYEVVHRLLVSEGRIKHVRERGQSFYDAEGRALRSIGTVQDVSAEIDSEQRLRLILDAMFPLVCVFDLDGKLIETNRPALAVLGMARDEVLGKVFAELPPWNALPQSQDKLRTALARAGRGEIVRDDFDVHAPDEQALVMDLMFGPLRGGSGKIEAIIGSGVDVTERKRAREALARSREQLRTIIDNEPECVKVLDTAGLILDMNAAGLAMLEADTMQDVLGTPALDYLVERDRDAFRQLMASVLRGAKCQLAYEIVGLRGTHRHMETHAVPLWDQAHQRVTSVLAVTRDVSERIAAQRRVQQASDLLHAVLDSSPDAVFAKDLEHRFLLVNEAFARLQGLSPRDMVGRRDTDFWSVELAEGEPKKGTRGFHHDDREAFAGRQVRNPSDEVPVLNGERRVLDVIKMPLRNEQGEVYGVLAYGRDVTETRRMESELRGLNAELEDRVRERTASFERANRELEMFTYSVSHDLKAPLRAIAGYSGLLLADYAQRVDADGRTYLSNIRAATSQMNQLIDDLLAYSRMERRPLQASAVDLGMIMDRVLAEFEEALRARGAKLTVGPLCPVVRADRDGLALVFRNLIGNALKFSRAGQGPCIEIGERDVGTKCIVWVRDNGIGFDMKFHDRIFEIFQRLHRTEDYPGTGVGLAIVRKAMERIGGRVWAESRAGEGATFFVEIPR